MDGREREPERVTRKEGKKHKTGQQVREWTHLSDHEPHKVPNSFEKTANIKQI